MMARKTYPTGYWTFFCNPRKWEIDVFLRTAKTQVDWRVRIRYLLNLLEKPLLFSNMREDELIAADPYLIRAIQARTMPLQPGAFRRIMELSGLDQMYGF